MRAYDPKGIAQARSLLGDAIEYCQCLDDAVTQAEVCVIATEWSEFRERKPHQYRHLLAQPVLVDLRNVFSLKEMAAQGFTYVSVGRPAVEAGQVKTRQETRRRDHRARCRRALSDSRVANSRLTSCLS